MFQDGATIEELAARKWFRAMKFQACIVCGSNSTGALFYEDEDDPRDLDGEPVFLCSPHLSQVMKATEKREQPEATIEGPLFGTGGEQDGES